MLTCIISHDDSQDNSPIALMDSSSSNGPLIRVQFAVVEIAA